MNPAEAVMLVRYVRAICPQQKFDEYSPDVWYDLLGDYDLADCKEAAQIVGRQQPFIAPSEIIAEVRRIRGERIEAANVVYDGNPDETGAESARNLRLLLRAAGDGRLAPRGPVQAIPGRHPLQLEAGPSSRVQAALDAIGTMPPRIVPGVTNPLAVGCPHCAAAAGRPCRTKLSKRKMADPHPARVDRAERAAAGVDESEAVS